MGSFHLLPLLLVAQSLQKHISQHHVVIYEGLVLHRQNVDQTSPPQPNLICHSLIVPPGSGFLSQIDRLGIRGLQLLRFYHLPALKERAVHLIGKILIVVQIIKLIFI